MNEMNIADPPAAFEEVAKFMCEHGAELLTHLLLRYTGQILLSTENLATIHELADKYKIGALLSSTTLRLRVVLASHFVDALASKCRAAHDERKVRIEHEPDVPSPRKELKRGTSLKYVAKSVFPYCVVVCFGSECGWLGALARLRGIRSTLLVTLHTLDRYVPIAVWSQS